MDFLQGLDIVSILQNVAIVNAVFMVAGSLLPEKWFHGIGVAGGKITSVLLRKRLGKGAGEKTETFIQKRINALANGFNEGADADDSQ